LQNIKQREFLLLLKKMSDVEAQADHIRNWLKNCRSDLYTIECVDFLTDHDGMESYSIHVIARDANQETVGVLAFKIKYPYLKIYPCHVKPQASGKGLTCQMYMVPMAFAAEDKNIRTVVAKEVDGTLVRKFGFLPDGTLFVGDPLVRRQLLASMQTLYDACAGVVKLCTDRLAQAEMFVVSDKPGLDWSAVNPNFVQVGPAPPGRPAQSSG
jgi:hypothetical protein